MPPCPPLLPGRRRAAAFLADERAATAIEYALVAGLVAVTIVGALEAVSSSTGGFYAAFARIAVAIRAAAGG